MFAISKGWIPLTAGASQRFRTIKICPKDFFAGIVDCNGGIPLEQKGHVVSDMILKADQER